MSEVEDRLRLGIALAMRAGEISLRYYQSALLQTEWKPDASPVTQADREAEEAMRQVLAAESPHDAVIGEELGLKEGSTAYRWYLDPIDGTQSFIRGVPLFGVLVGLEHGDDAVAGVVLFPALKELVYAATGVGAWWVTGLDLSDPAAARATARPARVSEVAELRAATLSTTSLRAAGNHGRQAGHDRLLEAVAVGRGWSDCYGHYLVATGRIDIMVDPEMSVWDNAPLKPIVEEAGGRFTDLSGASTIHGASAVSTNGRLHDAVLQILDAASSDKR